MSSPVSLPCRVLIAPSEHLPALQQHARSDTDELLAFTDAEPLRALEIITKRRPSVVALERMFAATPRGTALIGRIKSDPSLAHAEILVVGHDDVPGLDRLRRSGTRAAAEAAAAPGADVPASPSLDRRGTRRAPRVRIADQVEVVVDRNAAALVDLSTVGAQVVSTAVLRPNQRVRVVMTDAQGTIRCGAVVAWASFEIPPRSGPRYRAGLQFIDADATQVAAYADRHKGPV